MNDLLLFGALFGGLWLFAKAIEAIVWWVIENHGNLDEAIKKLKKR